MQRVVWLGLLMVCVLAIASASASAPSLQALIDATPSGATLRLAPGVYAGPVTIRAPMVLQGDHHAVIQGNGRGTVLRVEAGWLLQGNGHVVEDNAFDRARDITLANSPHNRIMDNRCENNLTTGTVSAPGVAPMATFFRNFPALEILDFLERLAPFSTPYRLLRDPTPRMQ